MVGNVLPIPDFFVPQNARVRSFRPDTARLAVAARQVLGVTASQADTLRTLLFLVDPQMDFCHPDGSLFVGGRSGEGALQDCVRTSEFIYRNARRLTHVAATLDTHHLFQIFFPEFWLLADGQPPNAHTLIGLDGEQLVNRGSDGSVIGAVMPNPAILDDVCDYCQSHEWLVRQSKDYVRKLDRGGKHALYLWPHHCLLGSDGHRISGVIQEAMLYHSFLRHASLSLIPKGEHPLTENYSAFRPEVELSHDGLLLRQDNPGNLFDWVDQHDAIIIAGQALSHCVKATVEDLVKFSGIYSEPERTLGRYYLLTDCMSPVVIPGGPDFTDAANEALKSFEQAGMHLVQSTTPLDEWPDFPIVTY